MISINNVSVFFGSFELFKDITFMINKRDRIGLVGKNGAGKTTLLKLIAGLESPSEGNISYPNDIKLGYLPQQPKYTDGKTVVEETLTAFAEINQLKHTIEQLNLELAHRTDYESESYDKLLHQITDANDRFAVLGGSNTEALVEQTLTGLGFEAKDFTRQTSEFSGGWRMRIELAKLLLQRPDVFLLDEPTNHLDIESIQWLEDFLKDYPGAVLLISHDRAFLDHITDRTVEISLGKIHDYKAPYSKYVELRKERREQQLAAYKNQQKMIEDTQDFIERFRYKATKAVQVQSRIKQLEKIDIIEVEEEDNSALKFRFQPAPRAGTLVLEMKNLSKNYGKHEVLHGLDRVIERGEKIAFVGKNGEGKSTLAKIIIGTLDYTGEFKLGHNVSVGYYAQNSDELLDENRTVLQTLDDVAVGDIRTKIRDILGSFLFSGETVDKKVKVLSGGERSRLALAKLLLQPYNVLLLDEPTNHLDMRSKDILKQALAQYDGTLIVISHDRDFLDGLTDKIFEFRNKNIREHLCSIYEFLKKRKAEENQKLKDLKIAENAEKVEISDNKQDYLQRKAFDKEIRKVKNKLQQTETEIEKIDAEIEAAALKMSTPEFAADAAIFKQFDQLKKRQEELMYEWEILSTEVENLEKQRN